MARITTCSWSTWLCFSWCNSAAGEARGAPPGPAPAATRERIEEDRGDAHRGSDRDAVCRGEIRGALCPHHERGAGASEETVHDRDVDLALRRGRGVHDFHPWH